MGWDGDGELAFADKRREVRKQRVIGRAIRARSVFFFVHYFENSECVTGSA
jgi:hypothetical protein